ncbi:MAG: tol-pal system protein YbgF [Acidobacteriota bacterium]
MKRKISLVLLLFASALSLTGCITPKQFDMVQSNISDIQEKISVLKKEISEAGSKIDRIDEKMENQEQKSRTGQADVQIKIEALSRDIQILLDRLADTNQRISTLSQEILATKEILRAAPQIPSQVSGAQPAATSGAASGEKPFLPSNPDELFKSSYADYSKGNYALAISGFQEYIVRYPKSDLTDNAQYWIGECYFSQGNHKSAIDEFDKVIENFPDGDKVPGAYLKKGLALFEMHQTAKGVMQLQYLIGRYPKSDEARIAKDKLKSMGASF